jgi:hypothetical protein
MGMKEKNDFLNYKSHQNSALISEILSSINDLNNNVDRSLNDFREQEFKKNIYRYASLRNNYSLINQNTCYERINKRPPPKRINVPNLKLCNNVLKENIFLSPRNKESYGKEESVNQHVYDDNAHFCISVDTLQPLYIPKTVKYIWTTDKIEFSEGVQLKADLQTYLQYSDFERVKLINELTDIRFVTQADIENDACDKELIGHKGVFASKSIPRLTIIGIYGGILLRDDYDLLTLAKRTPVKLYQDYLFRISINRPYPKVSAFQHGNRISLINSASNYKENDGVATSVKLHQRKNIMLVTAKTNECNISSIMDNDEIPDILFLTACRDIKKGEQLLYDYGNTYW